MAKKTVKNAKKQDQQRQMLIVGGGIVAAIILLAIVVFLVQQNASLDVCKYDDESCYGLYLGIEQGKNDEGIPYIGSPDANVVIAEFGDFSCPHCADFHPVVDRLIQDFVRDGNVRLEYYPMSFLAAPYSDTSAQAAVCAIEQDAFWQYQAELYEMQKAKSHTSFTQDNLVSLSKDMGLDSDQLKSCINSNTPRTAMATADATAQRLGVTGTPTVFYSVDGGQNWQQVTADYSSISNTLSAFIS